MGAVYPFDGFYLAAPPVRGSHRCLPQGTGEPGAERRCQRLAEAYHRLGFQTLADQVRRSVRSVRGNQWMFRLGHPADQPLRAVGLSCLSGRRTMRYRC